MTQETSRRRLRRRTNRKTILHFVIASIIRISRLIGAVPLILLFYATLLLLVWLGSSIHIFHSIHNNNNNNPTTTHHIRYLSKQSQFVNNQSKSLSKLSKYIVFRQYREGQGAGNQIHGLLAALILGREFHRLVCISQEETDLLDVFQPILPQALEDCPKLPSNSDNSSSLDLLLLNFDINSPDECKIRTILESKEPIVYFSGNTYPRWPDIPKKVFEQYFQPTPQLLSVLPWTEPLKVVVHLRHGDSKHDIRQGLDLDTFRQLGKLLPPDTFLVTNWLSWYDWFHTEFGWRHPPWISVQHSAIQGIQWAERTYPQITNTTIVITSKDRNRQLWADWYTIMKATERVFHTHSDFSLSAIHCSDVDSRTILGLFPQNGSLYLTTEWWRQGPHTTNPPPLSLRTQQQLEGCQDL